MALSPVQEQSIAPYLNGHYVTVATWLDPAPPVVQQPPPPPSLLARYAQPALSIEFATPEAFFPLRLTRVYGEQPVPARLYVTGYVRPETAAPITSDMKVTHYWSHYD